MQAKRVVTRSRVASRSKISEFQFGENDLPIYEDGRTTPGFLREYYLRAWEASQDLPMPTTSDEPWRRTDLRGLAAERFILSRNSADLPVVRTDQAGVMVSDEEAREGGRIMITPREIVSRLDPVLSEKGVIFTDLRTAWQQHPALLEKVLGKIVRPDEGKFAAITAAMASAGVFVYIPSGVTIEQALHSQMWVAGNELAYFSHILVYVDDNASLTYLHESTSPDSDSGQSLNGCIVEVHVGENSHLKLVEMQTLGSQVWNFTHERARVDRNGNLDWVFGAVGSHLTKSFADLDLIGTGASGRMSGFYFTDNDQHLDHDTQQNHLAANTTSDLLFKGALKDKSRSVWQGMIYVAPGAQKTDGYQANRNLVLSNSARADSIPGLEILADDVRCTHGATVGKIDPEELFYILSRGIQREDAERLIVEGFFDPIMQRIPFEGVRTRLEDVISKKMR